MEASKAGGRIERPPRKRKSRRGQITAYDGWWIKELPSHLEWTGPIRCDYMQDFGFDPGCLTIEERIPTSISNVPHRSFVSIQVPKLCVKIFAHFHEYWAHDGCVAIYTDGNKITMLRKGELVGCLFYKVVGAIKISRDYQRFLQYRWRTPISKEKWRAEVDLFFDSERRRELLDPSPVEWFKPMPPMRMPVIQSKGRIVQWPSERVLSGR